MHSQRTSPHRTVFVHDTPPLDGPREDAIEILGGETLITLFVNLLPTDQPNVYTNVIIFPFWFDDETQRWYRDTDQGQGFDYVGNSIHVYRVRTRKVVFLVMGNEEFSSCELRYMSSFGIS